MERVAALVALRVVPATSATSMRTHLCGELRSGDIGATVAVCGWVARRREHGEHLAFVDVRDHSGVVQCVVDNTVDVRSEYVVRVTGTVRRRPRAPSTPTCRPARSRSATAPSRCCASAEPPPFPIDARADDVDENVRLQYRYLDLRRERMQRNLRLRVAGQLGDPHGDGGSGFRRGRDSDARAVDARGRPRVPRAVAQGARLVLRPAAVAAAVQAAADGRRRRPLLPDRPLPPRRGPARRPPVRVHAARRRDELRRPGRRAGGDLRGRARRRRGGDRRAPAGDRADHLARGDGALRRRQARPALRHGARRAHRRVRRRPSSRRSPRRRRSRASTSRGRPGSTGATSSTSSPTGPRRSAPRASCG